jgi:hypothetical protein
VAVEDVFFDTLLDVFIGVVAASVLLDIGLDGVAAAGGFLGILLDISDGDGLADPVLEASAVIRAFRGRLAAEGTFLED